MPESVALAVVAVATAVYAVFTGLLVRETRRLHEVQGEPVVGVFLSQREAWEPLFQFVVRNFGYGSAKNVRWQVTGDMEDLRQRKVEIDAILAVRTLPYLPPGQDIRFNLGTTFALLGDAAVPAKPIHVKVLYEDRRGKPYESEFVLNAESFRDAAFGATPALEKIAKTLDEILRELRRNPL